MVGIVRLARRMMQSDFRQRAIECVLLPLLAAVPRQPDYYQVVPAVQDRPQRWRCNWHSIPSRRFTA